MSCAVHLCLMIDSPKYVRFTEESNALDYLEKAVAFINTARAKPVDWKWVILAIHGALYGFMICALKGTDPDNVCTKNKAGKLKLIDFREALKRCQESARNHISGFAKALEVTEDQKRALSYIHDEFRNQFVHYRAACWSIGLDGMPEIITHGLDVIRAVALDMGNYYVHYDAQKVASLVTEGIGALLEAN